jgi:hypothetical protein
MSFSLDCVRSISQVFRVYSIPSPRLELLGVLTPLAAQKMIIHNFKACFQIIVHPGERTRLASAWIALDRLSTSQTADKQLDYKKSAPHIAKPVQQTHIIVQNAVRSQMCRTVRLAGAITVDR